MFFGVLRVIEINVKDDFLLKNEVLLSKKSLLFMKENIPKYKGNFQKILKRVYLFDHIFLKTNVSFKTPP